LYSEQRDLAIPKKKFQFVRKTKKEMTEVASTALTSETKKTVVQQA
jgi:hypothetical protein